MRSSKQIFGRLSGILWFELLLSLGLDEATMHGAILAALSGRGRLLSEH